MTATNNYNREHNDYNKEHNACKKYNIMQTWENKKWGAWKKKKIAFNKGQQWREEGDMQRTQWSGNKKSLMFKKIQSSLDDDHKLAKMFRALKLKCGN